MAAVWAEPVVLGGIAVIVLLLLVLILLLYRRSRRMSSSVDDAVMEALARISKAGSDLRDGLDEQAAVKAAPHLRELLKCVAIGLADRDGSLLAWDGEAAEHYEDLGNAIASAVTNHRREQIQHENLPCSYRAGCPMRVAVVVPLIVESDDAGALVVLGAGSGKQLLRMADETAKFVTTQLQLARLDESRQELAQAELRALRAQISPHFVYNALNTISSLIRSDPERARELLEEFAEFTRYSFRTSGMFTTLADELRNVDRYLEIERARYEGRLNVRLKIAPEVLSVVIPFLTVQPLVENAVRHGLAAKQGGGTVTVIARDHGAEALIIVEDDGVGVDLDELMSSPASQHTSGAHVGIGNVDQRMRSVFGPGFGLSLESAPNAGFQVSLRVPKYMRGVHPTQESYDDEEPPPGGRTGGPRKDPPTNSASTSTDRRIGR